MFEQVKQKIDDKIKTNGNNEITANRLNGVLQDMMDASAEVIEEVQQSIGDQVEANPTGEATETLGKIKIGETIYTAPQGPQGEPGADGQDGQPGAPGPANTLSIGTVTDGEQAAANITGEAPNQQLNLVLPKGEKGDPGQNAVNPFKGLFKGTSNLPATGEDGDFLYVFDVNSGKTTVYAWNENATPPAWEQVLDSNNDPVEIDDASIQYLLEGLRQLSGKILQFGTYIVPLLKKVVYIDNDAESYINAIEWVLSNDTILSITASYDSTHQVVVGSSLDSLKPYLTVTANYLSGLSVEVIGYTLTGDLDTIGTQPINVTYLGKTASFNVVVVAIQEIYSNTNVTSDNVNTGVKLFDSPKNWTIVIDYSVQNSLWSSGVSEDKGVLGLSTNPEIAVFRFGRARAGSYYGMENNAQASQTPTGYYSALIMKGASDTINKCVVLGSKSMSVERYRAALRYNAVTGRIDGVQKVSDTIVNENFDRWYLATPAVTQDTVCLNVASTGTVGATIHEVKIYNVCMTDQQMLNYVNNV